MRTLANKKVAAVAAGAIVVASAGAAYAYWTTSGSGTGSAEARSHADGEAVVLTQAVEITGLYPDGPAQDIVVTATNPAPYDQEVGEVTVEVTYPTDCGASNWVLTEATAEFGLLQAANAGDTDEATAAVGTFQLKDTGENQDACKGDVPTFAFSSAPAA